jgi:hypothetical protein
MYHILVGEKFPSRITSVCGVLITGENKVYLHYLNPLRRLQCRTRIRSTLFSVCVVTPLVQKVFADFLSEVFTWIFCDYFNGCCYICWRIITLKLRRISVFQVILGFKHSKEKMMYLFLESLYTKAEMPCSVSEIRGALLSEDDLTMSSSISRRSSRLLESSLILYRASEVKIYSFCIEY